MPNSEDKKALEDAYKELKEAGGLAVWNDIVTPAVKDDFNNVITPAVTKDFDIFIIPLKVKEGWVSSGIANAKQRVFLVAGQQLLDYGVSFDEQGETITYNGTTYMVDLDMGYETGNVMFLHQFICSVTS